MKGGKCASHARDVPPPAVRAGRCRGVCTSHMRNAVVVNVLRCGSGLGDGAGSGRPGAAAYYCASMRGYSNKIRLLIENILNLTNYLV